MEKDERGTSGPATKTQEEQVVETEDTTSEETAMSQAGEKAEVQLDDPQPGYEINPDTWSVIPIENENERVVLLTIDDAPDKYGLQMAQTLNQLGVKAIFFVNGHFLDSEEEANTLKQIHELGFPIGNHTYSHRNLSKLTHEEQREEIISLNDRVEEIIGERPKFFRAPFGVNTDVSRQIVSEENMLLMNWTYGYDWEKEYQTKEALAVIMVNTPFLKNGANLLMHDRAWTNEALMEIVKGIQEKGYEIVDPNAIKKPK